jgi:hypothetical protein
MAQADERRQPPGAQEREGSRAEGLVAERRRNNARCEQVGLLPRTSRSSHREMEAPGRGKQQPERSESAMRPVLTPEHRPATLRPLLRRGLRVSFDLFGRSRCQPLRGLATASDRFLAGAAGDYSEPAMSLVTDAVRREGDTLGTAKSCAGGSRRPQPVVGSPARRQPRLGLAVTGSTEPLWRSTNSVARQLATGDRGIEAEHARARR